MVFLLGFPGSSVHKESACNAGDLDSIPGLGRSSGEEIGYSLQDSGLENSMDQGVWQATVHGVTKSQTQLSDFLLTSKPSGIIEYQKNQDQGKTCLIQTENSPQAIIDSLGCANGYGELKQRHKR